MIATALTLSIIANVWLAHAHKRNNTALKIAEKSARMFRRLKSRLHLHLERWEREEFCENCKQYGNKHTLNCPSIVIRFAITKAEQEASN